MKLYLSGMLTQKQDIFLIDFKNSVFAIFGNIQFASQTKKGRQYEYGNIKLLL